MTGTFPLKDLLEHDKFWLFSQKYDILAHTLNLSYASKVLLNTYIHYPYLNILIKLRLLVYICIQSSLFDLFLHNVIQVSWVFIYIVFMQKIELIPHIVL